MNINDKLTLVNPNRYKKTWVNVTRDVTISDISWATIEKKTSCLYVLTIDYGCGVFQDCASSIRGCKKIFTHHTNQGAKWKNNNI